MAQEIEKKYLVIKDKLPKLLQGVLYTQGYLSITPLIRFRIIGNEVCLNIKKIYKNSSVREEWEFFNKLSDLEIKKLTKLSLEKPIKKIRYKIKHKGFVWEIDVYQGDNKGLITAEVELENKKIITPFPEWVNNKKEISDEKKYFNRNLGICPYKSFKKKL